MTRIARTNLNSASQFVALRREFSTSNMFGRKEFDSHFPGNLPVEFHADFEKAKKAPDFYVVTSFATPIAWFADHVWYVPNARYSQTTSRHQSALNLVRDGKVWNTPRSERAYAYCGG